ncbi:site-specific DNA-methyltransferase [Martelella sp. AD-3]|uniref:DNA-methyltransferase n=1 Tax=Martelella sp. AD-3 TaxID=686597 RepID=UPI00046444D4|nr:site-specific DNA-methyltransferase [Martelella sp. AD-3]AMM84135.1 DNA methylase [Martelella sp. AD-3]
MTEPLDILGDGRATILIGDCRDVLAEMEPDSVDCVVTSPPYWGLRDYGVEGQIGLEPTLAEHLSVMVDVFEAVRRVLKPTGTLWLNYGDCYATAPNGRSAQDTKNFGGDDRTFRDKPFSTVGNGLKPKDLCMVPNRLAIALQDAGWWVRSEIIWGKTNPMPDSSGTARPSTAHEKIFLLTKSADGDIWRARDTGELSFFPDLSETCPLVTDATRQGPRWLRIGSYYDAGAVSMGSNPANHGGARGAARATVPPRHEGQINHTGLHALGRGTGRLLRNYEPAPIAPASLDVWPMATLAFRAAHFATFPPVLASRCILAGCPKGGTVLDPFGGAGTTALVALRHGRKAQLVEISRAYAEITCDRIAADWKAAPPMAHAPSTLPEGGLFQGRSNDMGEADGR